MINDVLLTDESQLFNTIPDAIVDLAADADGYIQVTVEKDGKIHVRGSRHMVARLVDELRAQGVELQFSELHWCG